MTRQFLYVWAALLVSSSTLLAIDGKSPSTAEQAKAVEAAKQRMMQQFDTNRDGVLSEQEKARAEEALRQQGFPLMPGGAVGNDPFLKPFDRDGDGKLSPLEQRAAREAWDKMRRNNGGPQRGFTPGGGGPSGTPAPAAPAADAKPEKVSPLVKRFDKDGDGKLNDEEKAAAQAELKGKKKEKGEKGDKAKDKDAKKPADKAGK